MKGFGDALSLFFRGSRGWLALAFSAGSLTASAVTFTATQSMPVHTEAELYGPGFPTAGGDPAVSGTNAYSLAGTITKSGNTVSVDATSSLVSWSWTTTRSGYDSYPKMSAIWHEAIVTFELNGTPVTDREYQFSLSWWDVPPFDTGDEKNGTRAGELWFADFDATDLNGVLQIYWEPLGGAEAFGFERKLLGTVTVGNDQSLKRLTFSLTNNSDVWKFGAIFAEEQSGMAVSVKRIAPHTTDSLVINVLTSDTTHYYAAFVDAAASNAAGALQTVVRNPDGTSSVVHSNMVPAEGTQTASQTQADGVPVSTAGAGVFVGGAAHAPKPSIPSPTPTTGDASPATNAHLSEVGNSISGNITNALRSVDESVKQQGGLTQLSLGEIADRLEEIRNSSRSIDERGKLEKQRIDQVIEDNPTVGDMNSAGASASAEIRAVYGTRPSGKGYALDASGAPNLTVAMPTAFGGKTFDLNPFQAGRFQTLCTWFRAATAWLVIGLLGGWAWSQVGEWTRGFSTLAQARGNAVVAGTGAQGTALVAAGLITVAIVTGTTTLLSWAFDDINFASFVAVTTTNPVATIPTGILWMLDQVLPVAVIITAFVARITFNIYASTVFAGAAAVVRFIVP